MIESIKTVLILALVATTIKFMSESFLIKHFRIYLIWKDTVLATEVFKILKKISWIYRVCAELLIIWVVFEWRGGFIEQLAIKLIMKFWSKAQKIVFMFSPYARKWMDDTAVEKWMRYYSIALILMAIYFLITILCYTKKMNRLGVSLMILCCDSYVGLGLAKAMTYLAFANTYLTMVIFIGAVVLVHILLFTVYHNKT